MKLTSNRAGWAIELEGDPQAIVDLRLMLTPGFDPCVEDYNGRVLLRAKKIDQLVDANEARMAAEVLLQLLNGAALLEHADAKPLKVRHLVQFGPNGKQLGLATGFTITIAPAHVPYKASNS